MERKEEINNILKNGEEIIMERRIAGGEIYLTNERIITNKISLMKKISLSSQTSFSSIPLADIVSSRIARGIPFFSLPRLIVAYKEKGRMMEVFFEFADKADLQDFYQEFCKVFTLSLRATERSVAISSDCFVATLLAMTFYLMRYIN